MNLFTAAPAIDVRVVEEVVTCLVGGDNCLFALLPSPWGDIVWIPSASDPHTAVSKSRYVDVRVGNALELHVAPVLPGI